MYKVYAKLDSNNCIERIESTAFYSEKELKKQGFIQIDEGEDGFTFGHAQANYLLNKFSHDLFDLKGHLNFKFVNGKISELTPDEKAEYFPPVKPEPTEQEKFNAQIMKTIATLTLLIRGGKKNV